MTSLYQFKSWHCKIYLSLLKGPAYFNCTYVLYFLLLSEPSNMQPRKKTNLVSKPNFKQPKKLRSKILNLLQKTGNNPTHLGGRVGSLNWHTPRGKLLSWERIRAENVFYYSSRMSILGPLNKFAHLTLYPHSWKSSTMHKTPRQWSQPQTLFSPSGVSQELCPLTLSLNKILHVALLPCVFVKLILWLCEQEPCYHCEMQQVGLRLCWFCFWLDWYYFPSELPEIGNKWKARVNLNEINCGVLSTLYKHFVLGMVLLP